MSERDPKMTRENRVEPGQGPRGDQEFERRDGKSQGIVRDERGQEQPADKERAQRVHKTKEGQACG
jgi:hypothetical protein